MNKRKFLVVVFCLVLSLSAVVGADETEFEVLSRHMLNASQTIRLIRSLKEKIPPSDPEDS